MKHLHCITIVEKSGSKEINHRIPLSFTDEQIDQITGRFSGPLSLSEFLVQEYSQYLWKIDITKILRIVKETVIEDGVYENPIEVMYKEDMEVLGNKLLLTKIIKNSALDIKYAEKYIDLYEKDRFYSKNRLLNSFVQEIKHKMIEAKRNLRVNPGTEYSQYCIEFDDFVKKECSGPTGMRRAYERHKKVKAALLEEKNKKGSSQDSKPSPFNPDITLFGQDVPDQGRQIL